MSSLSLILPCYNEAESLPSLVQRALECAKKRRVGPKEFTLILVDNGSSDRSAQVMQELKSGADGDYIQIVTVCPNGGYGNGVFEGLKASRSDFIAWTHADEQCDPEDVFRGWDKIRVQSKKILIKGRRSGRAFRERFISKGFEIAVFVILGKCLQEINAQPKVFDRSLLNELKNPPKDFAFDLYVLMRAREAGYVIEEIDVLFPDRRFGQSNWSATFRSRLRTILKMFEYLFRYRAERPKVL